ncbi:PTS sugar transporter subunit IIB [Pediococcus pentosaceus]|uniref:PTS sugar transporter subunit IIB n=1 Tax=Pediococcus pentosaceus TaxID=1255 RepID=UPI001909ACE3|nr:PTS sugar transporter subunit IIB [Pediococcus pentosaceus]MBF7126066.1 PTS sugar transporter subunit IIB [Pediococcus pentosaceus]WPK16800.1 PTS sugar transporter subunit IIB [Pediococcus pentosaceus]
MIKVVRIDHRLLHGQVIFAWTKSQGIERIIVIDNDAAGDDFKKMSLKLSVFSVTQAKERMEKINKLKSNTMVIFGDVLQAGEIIPDLNGITEVNYGGVKNRPDTKRYSNAVFLNDEEVRSSQRLKEQGITLFMQQVPTSKRESLDALI